jgi:hypothetical protein
MDGVGSEAPPRSEATVARLTSVATARIARFARSLFIGALAFGAATSLLPIVIKATGSPSDQYDWSDAITSAVLLCIFAGLLPGVVVRALIRRDMRSSQQLVRDGVVHSARVIQHARAYGGMHVVSVAWETGDKTAYAHFDLPKLEGPLPDGPFTLLADSKRRVVGADLGINGFQVGARSWSSTPKRKLKAA